MVLAEVTASEKCCHYLSLAVTFLPFSPFPQQCLVLRSVMGPITDRWCSGEPLGPQEGSRGSQGPESPSERKGKGPEVLEAL